MSVSAREVCEDSSWGAKLRRRLQTARNHVDDLIIAHDEPELLCCLAEAVPLPRTLLFPVPQTEWDQHLSEIVQAARDCGTQRIGLAGHSLGLADVRFRNDPKAGSEPKNAGSAEGSGHNRLWAGVQQSQRQIRQSRQHFERHLEQTWRQSRRTSAGRSGLELWMGLFFLAESRCFIRFVCGESQGDHACQERTDDAARLKVAVG